MAADKEPRPAFHDLVARSAAMQRLFDKVDRVARSTVSVVTLSHTDSVPRACAGCSDHRDRGRVGAMQPDDPSDSGEEDFAALLAASEQQTSRLTAGQLVSGRVVSVGATAAFVEIGGKGEAVIDIAEFRDAQTGAVSLAIGDRIEATVVDDGTTSGTVVLKRTVGRGSHVPGELEQALAHHIAVEGVVTAEIKGGFEVQVAGVRAFCPGSQIDRRRVEGTSYVGQRLRFLVTRIESGGRNIVVSRRDLLEEEAAQEAARTWERIEVGAVLEGRVSSLRDFGAFVDLGGVEGLLHVSELSHSRTANPHELLQVDQAVTVKVVSVDAAGEGGRRRIGLSLRALAPDPWLTVGERFSVGSTVRGTVRRLEPFGAFVEIAPGVDGLVHVSKLALDRRISHPRQVVGIGDAVDVTIVAVDGEQRRISLSLVEQMKRARDAEDAATRRAEDVALDQLNEKRSLGTFADLLAASKRKPR
jgi:small subunit ribosomal protein S1